MTFEYYNNSNNVREHSKKKFNQKLVPYEFVS